MAIPDPPGYVPQPERPPVCYEGELRKDGKHCTKYEVRFFLIFSYGKAIAFELNRLRSCCPNTKIE